jgi:hypothetical protein
MRWVKKTETTGRKRGRPRVNRQEGSVEASEEERLEAFSDNDANPGNDQSGMAEDDA